MPNGGALKFRPGRDRVRVVRGMHKGVEGLVVAYEKVRQYYSLRVMRDGHIDFIRVRGRCLEKVGE